MAFNFKEAAQAATQLSPIMVGRKKIKTEDIINKELTIIGFDFAPKFDESSQPIVNVETGEVDTYGIIIFKEIPDAYYCVGVVFTKVCHAWATEFGSARDASTELEKSGGVKVRFTSSRTNTGKNLTNVEILD